MREALDPWTYVIASYAIGFSGTVLLIGWAWIAMRRAEARRERSREP